MREENIRYFGPETVTAIVENLRRADHLIAVSKFARDAYQGLLNGSKITVVYNGLNTKKMAPPAEKRRYNVVTLLSVCSLVELKKIDLVLSVLKNIKREQNASFKYVIVGDGYKKQCYMELINRYDLQQDVELAGIVPPERISSYYHMCDIFVLPSVRESFGIVFLEAMYCGKPVICSSQSGISEIIENGRQGYIVQPDDGLDLKQKMLKLILDPQLRFQMGNAGQELVKNFTVERQARDILAVYRSLIKGQ